MPRFCFKRQLTHCIETRRVVFATIKQRSRDFKTTNTSTYTTLNLQYLYPHCISTSFQQHPTMTKRKMTRLLFKRVAFFNLSVFRQLLPTPNKDIHPFRYSSPEATPPQHLKTLDSEPVAQNPKPQRPHPKTETVDCKPKTLDPET